MNRPCPGSNGDEAASLTFLIAPLRRFESPPLLVLTPPNNTKSLSITCPRDPYCLMSGRWRRAKFEPSRPTVPVGVFRRGRPHIDVWRHWWQYTAYTLPPNSRWYSTLYKQMAMTSRRVFDLGICPLPPLQYCTAKSPKITNPPVSSRILYGARGCQ